MLIQWRRGTEIMGEKPEEDKEGSGACSNSSVFCSAYYTPGGPRALIINQRAAGKSQEMQTLHWLGKCGWTWASEEIHTLCWVHRLHCWIFSLSAPESCAFLCSGLMAACVSGVEAEAEVCCPEEAALVHRWGEPGAEGLPAGGPQLARSLLVQVCTEAGMFILWLFCPKRIWHFSFSSEVFSHLLSAAWRISNVIMPSCIADTASRNYLKHEFKKPCVKTKRIFPVWACSHDEFGCCVSLVHISPRFPLT